MDMGIFMNLKKGWGLKRFEIYTDARMGYIGETTESVTFKLKRF